MSGAEIRYNIHCRFCMNDEYLIYYFLDLCIKLKNEVKPKWVMRLPDPSITDESMLMFSGIKGLGLKRIKNLFLEFGSPEYIFNATIKELASVDKIGKKTAKHIKDVYYTMIDDIDSNLKIKEIDKVGKW